MAPEGGSVNRVILAVDTGRATGWAVAYGGRLAACGLAQVKDDAPIALPTVSGALVLVEYPIHRREGGKDIDPNDIIKLGSRAGRVQEKYLVLGNRVRMVFPSEWKGSIPKEIHHDRIRSSLSPEARDVVSRDLANVAPSLRHNVLDAIGLVLWGVKLK